MQKSLMWILLVLALAALIIIPNYVSAGKSDQYFTGNLTCEDFIDSVLWSALSPKSASIDVYLNWTPEIGCNSSLSTLGPKNCDIRSLHSFVRYAAVGTKDSTAGNTFIQIANTTQSGPFANGTRHIAFLNQSILAGDVLGPRVECGTGASATTCSVNSSGFNESNFNYSVHIKAGEATANTRMLLDNFEVRYPWCWTPIIYDATVSPESQVFTDTFTFTINVTNPGANTTVRLLTRSIGGSWAQEGNPQDCVNCARTKLTFPVTFSQSQVGNREFKFNATDNQSFTVEAGNPSTLGTATNECLDSGNDCVFTIEDEEVATGTPILTDEKVNGVQSGATEGWGTNWTFSANVSNPVDGAGDINLTLLVDSGAGFIQKDSQNCTDPCSTSTKFTFFVDDFMCADISSAQYRFTATNLNGTSTVTQPFTIEKDDIIFEHVQGNNTISNRSGSQFTPLALRVFDTDKAPSGEYLSSGTNITFSVHTGVSYFTHSSYVVATNSTGHVTFDFNASCLGDFSGAPKFLVGNRNWKGETLASTQCYKATTSEELNTSIRGDIELEFVRPDGSVNFTQEDSINFLGATTDDCTDALAATVVYNANITAGDGFACTDTTQIGANAFTCDFQTDITTSEGFYNTTMFANFSFHYDNQTSNTNTPGLFNIFPVKKLENPRGNSSAGQGSSTNGWGNPNWNFTITASSGDANNVYQVDLLMAQTVNPTAPGGICNATQGGCLNQTPIVCDNCINQEVTYYRNFTNTQQGTWFFRFALNDSETQTSGTDFSVEVEEDDTNISYGGTGNATTVIKDTQPQNLTVRVFDIDKNSFNVTVPSANVTFKLLDDGYAGGEKIIGSAFTNSTGHARFLFNATECTFIEGSQKWVGEIESSETNYKPSVSENFTITLDLTGCEAAISVENVLTAGEMFQNVNFTVNATIAAFVSTANNVNATLNTPAGWIIGPSATQGLGSVIPGTPETVSWEVNATSYGTYNVSVFADSSDAGNDTTVSGLFDVHKESLEGTADSPALPQVISANSNLTTQWNCNIGDYRIATLNINANTSNNIIPIRVETYNGTDFVDVLHSKYVNTSNLIETVRVPLLENQINANETGNCVVRISNLGSSSINITDVTLDAYYDEVVAVRDIQASANSVNTTGLETSDDLLNVSVIVENSINESHSLNVNLTIKNSTTTVFTNENTGLTLSALSTLTTDFLNINTSTWTAGNYTLEALITGNFSSSDNENRSEILIFEDIQIFADTEDYMCAETTEAFIVTINHPFTDTIEYNVSLEMPSGWNYSGSQLINILSIGNTTLSFNVTASNSTAENVTINATIAYTYPTNKTKKANQSVEEGNSIPILEVTRETPTRIGTDRVFESSLTIHNNGCAAASSAVVTESLSTGWTPANPGILTNEFGQDIQLVSAVTDLETNIITWSLGQIQENRYAVLIYQIKSPVGTATTGELEYTSAWDSGRTNNESEKFIIQTMNYSSESHLQFELKAVQQSAFPQPEVRSAQPNTTYNYTLEVGNIGDINATGWNVTLEIPLQCDVPAVFQSGTYNSTSGIITWILPELGVRPSATAFTDLNFTVNCTEARDYIFAAKGIKDTRAKTSFSNATGIGCSFTSGNDCSTTQSFTFSKPSDPRYETLNNVNTTIFYNWFDYKTTIGEGSVNITNDDGRGNILWQNYSITTPDGTSGTVFSNYTLDNVEKALFVNAARNIGVRAFVDATDSPDGNVTVTKLDYTWDHGKLFEESQDFFAITKVYTYTPLLQNATLYINNPTLDPNLGLTANNTTAERTGGWGEEFNFSIETRDRFGRNITIFAWHEKEGGGFTQIGNFTCVDCDSGFQQINFTYDYNGSDITGVGGWNFKFNATNEDGNSELLGFTYTVEKDDINTDYIAPDNEININRNESTVFSVRSFDTDLGVFPNGSSEAIGKIYISTVGFDTVFESSPATIAADDGYFNRTITNTFWCDNEFFLGKHGWYGGTEAADFVKNNLTKDFIGVRNFTLVGSLNNTLELPANGSSFVIGNPVTFDGSVNDDCSADSTSAATITYNMSNGAFWATCTAGAGGDCQIATNVSFPVGSYNVTMKSNRTGHNNGSLFAENRLTLRSVPSLKDARIDINSDGFGVPRTFSVNVTDNTGDNVTVQMWQDLGSGFQLVETDSCVSCSNAVLSFTTGYQCANFGTGKTFKFNATDTEGNDYETTIGAGDYRGGVNTFVIERDDVLLEFFAGNESVVNLLNSSEFIVRVFDTDNQTYNLLETATVTFNVTKTGIGGTYSIVGTNTTNSTGYAGFFFTPDQTFAVTKQNWLGFTQQQTCYNFATSSAFNVTTLTNAPQLVNETVSPQTAGWGIQRTFNVTVRDFNNTADVLLWRATSLSGPWTLMNQSSYTDVGNFQTLSFVQTFSPTLIGTHFFKFNATNEVNNINSTAETAANNFTLNNNQILLTYEAGHNSISNRSGNQTTLFAFRVQDENGTFLQDFPMKFHVQSAGVGFFTDERFVVLTNSSGYANFNFNATCLGEFTGSPKFLVGTQQWKVTVNDSELNFYQQNDSSSFITRNTSVRGDISLDFSTPDGSQNFTQEQTITFLGATTDDCGDALVTTVVYNANSTLDSFSCTQTTQIGANAFQCIYTTSLDDARGFYNVTMLANASLHYDNQTSNTNDPGLFFLFPIKKLVNPTSVPTTAGWGSPNWNFSVLASSGDIDNILQVDLFMAQSVNPTTQCTGPTCVNQTSIICDASLGCVDQPVTYYRNFTSNQQGTWFFQFKFNDTALTSTSGTDFSVEVEKDDTNITYGGTGNATTVIKDTQPQNLTVRVFDIDKNSFNVTVPSANVTFKLLDAGYGGGEKVIGSAFTNSTGHARFLFNATACDFIEGTQTWVGEIESSETNYKASVSENFTITLDLTGCEAAISVENVLTAGEMFQNVNFTVNATIAAFVSTANNVNATLNTPAGWIIGPSATQELGSVIPGTPETVSWEVNATSYGTYNVSVFADSSDAGNDTTLSSNFNVYKEALEGSADSPSLPQIISGGDNIVTSWDCNIGDYRIATLNINANTSNNIIPIRVETYNGTDFVDVLHSKYVNTSNLIETVRVPVLENQINANETGSCAVRISNFGSSSINITDVTLDAYYNETVTVRDIQASVSGTNTTGFETTDELANVSVLVENSFNESHSLNVNLTIKNSTGFVVNTSLNSGLTLGAFSTLTTDFLNINTSTWTAGNYTLEALITGNFSSSDNENRSEILIFEDIEIFANSEDYMCDSATEPFTVTIFHPFTDTIEYNVSLEMPSGWNYSGSQQKNISTIGNNSFIFNITSSNATAENVTINATIDYTYPGISKSKEASHGVEEGDSIPILETIRESPQFVANRTELVTRLAVYNKGCATAEDISLTESVTSGWTAYTPSVDGVLAGVADIPRGEIRFTTSDLGTIRTQEYRILAYFILPPTGINEEAELRYNLTWGSKNHHEDSAFKINTSKYISESRLSYNIRAVDSFKDRSAEKDEDQLYEFNITNIGDLNITNSTWNVTLNVPAQCAQSNHTGTFNATTGKITWPLGPLNITDTNTFFLNLNCTTEDRYLLKAEGINDTTTEIDVANTSIGIGCAGSESCSTTQGYLFFEPDGLRYPIIKDFTMLVFYDWSGYKLTLGTGQTKDADRDRVGWQNYTMNPNGTSGTSVLRYTADESELIEVEPGVVHNLTVRGTADATANPSVNITILHINNTWQTGTLFNETQNLFIDIHPFIFDLPTPILSTPTNGSLQAAVPVGLSWETIEEPVGINISYYVFGDDTDATTLLTQTEENLFLWRDLGAQQGTFFWKVIATDGTSNTTSETRQFTLDLCQPNTDFAFANNYPMSYNESTDTITIWGSNGTNFDAMGNNESNPITFQEIFEFGQVARGICAINNPSSGAYAVLSRLEMGNTSDNLNTTFVRTIGESLSFSKQLQLNFNATFISGNLTSGGSPFAGSTLSFSGLDATDNEEGQFYLKNGSELRLYNTGISHTISANNSNPFRLYWNGNVISKSSTLQNWYTIRFVGANNSLDDLILTNMGEGFFPASTQVGELTRIRPSGIDTGGLILEGDSNITITNLQISEATNDILVINYTGTTDLINPTLNFSNLNWTTGSFSGQINRKAEYTSITTDAAGTAVANVTIGLVDLRGDTVFDLITDSNGEIPVQIVTRAIFDYDHKTGDERGPHLLKSKKFGKNFITLTKQFSAATIETLQLSENPFMTLSEAQVLNLTGITFVAPTAVSYGSEIYTNYNITGYLNNTPITQSEFFSVFGYNGADDDRKLTLVTDAPDANGEYSANYETGLLTFFNNQSGHNVTPVYSYGGNITISTGTASANCIDMSELYAYMQYNLSETLTTVDGLSYTMFVDLIIGNSTTGGCIVDSTASIAFEDGYTYSFSSVGGYIDLAGITSGGGSSGSTINPLSIEDSVGAQYNPGNTVEVFSVTSDSTTGDLVSATVNVSVYYPNDTLLATGISNTISTGFYKFNTTLASNTPLGTYGVLIRANDSSGNIVNDVVSFKVESSSGGGSGGLALNIFNTVGTLYEPSDVVRLFSTTVNSSGALVNATVNVRAYNPDGTLLNSGTATRLSAGRTEYNFTAPSTEGTYRLEVDANFSGDNIFDTESFIIAVGGAGGGNATFPPQIQVEVPSTIDTNTNFGITMLATSDAGIPVNCAGNANLTVRNTLNGTNVLTDATMTNFGTGLYNYTYSTGTQSTYVALVDCFIGGIEYTGIKMFSTQNVSSDATGGSSGGAGGLPLNMFADTGAFYSPDDEVIVFALTTNSSGALVNATVNAAVFYPNGTQLNSGAATEQSLGRYKYNFTLPASAPTGTYQINLDANYSGDEIHSTLAFIISQTIENIATTVNQINTTVTNIQTTINNVNSTVNTINSTVNNINSAVNNINSTVNTINSTVNDIESTVNVINSTTQNTNTIVNQTQTTVNAINSKIDVINSTVNRIETNTQTINSTINTINSTVNNIDSDLEFINSTVEEINSVVNVINTTVTYTNTTVNSINTTVNLINSTVNNIWNLAVGKITLDADVGSQYNPSDSVALAITTVDGNNTLVNATVNVTTYYPNGTQLNAGQATRESTGRFNYSFTLPASAPTGTYSIDFDANYSGNEVHRNIVFKVETASSGGSGGLPLNIFNSVGGSYEPGDTVRISSTVVNSSGALVNATVNVFVYNPDSTLLNNGTSTLQSAGRYEYSFVAPSTQGTYTADIDANFSGDEIHDTEAFMVAVGGGAGGNLSTPPRVFVEAPTVIGLNTNFSITMLSTDDAGLAADCTTNTANLTIRDTISGTELVSNQPMTKFGTGLYNYTYSTSSASSYVAVAKCTLSTLEYTGITTFSTQGFSITGGNIVEISDFHEVAAGQQYRTKIWVFDINGNPINADSIPTVTLYDPLRNIIVQDVSMTQESTGVYIYNFTTSSGQTSGVWETIVNVTVNGVTSFPSDFWELESSPAEVTIHDIVDKTIPTISANATITNEGTGSQEYQYEYCIVAEQTNQCGGDDDEDYGSGAKLLSPGESFNTLLNLDLINTGDYYFKLVVYFGTEKSGASQLFTAVEEGAAPPVTPPSGAGGGGGAIIPEEPPIIGGKSYLFDIRVQIPDAYKEIFAGEKTGAEITITDLGSLKGTKNVTLEYSIQNSERVVLSSMFEQISVENVFKIFKEIKAPQELREGTYLFVARIEFEGESVAGSETFKIIGKEAPVTKIASSIGIILAIAIGIILITTIIILLRRRHEHHRENLKKIMRHIKESA